MKKLELFFSLLLVSALGCGFFTGKSIASEESATSTTNGLREATGTEDSAIIDGSSINISSENESAPDGMFQQLIWGGKGGGEGDTPTPTKVIQPCGKCNIELKDKTITMEGFLPNQIVSVPIYRLGDGFCGLGSANYVTTLKLQVDQNGYASYTLQGATDKIFIFVVKDKQTGKDIWTISSSVSCSLQNPTVITSCPGAPPQRLKINEMAYICTEIETVKLREGPGKGYPILKSLIPGADLKVIAGPSCGDNWSWWQVETESGFIGWMSEGGDTEDPYYLCPSQ